MTLTVDDRELIERALAWTVYDDADTMITQLTTRLQSLLSDTDKLRDALTNLAEAARNTVGQRADPSLTEALAEADYAALIQTEVP